MKKTINEQIRIITKGVDSIVNEDELRKKLVKLSK